MTGRDQAIPAGNALFEAFVEQVKQVLEHLYDFAYLQQHPLARIYDQNGDLSAKTAGRQLRQELLTVIESLKPQGESHFRAPAARLHNILHVYYVENLTVQDASIELGLSERQAYRDLRRGQESVAIALWDKRLPLTEPDRNDLHMGNEFSVDSEIARLKLDFSMVDFAVLVQHSLAAVERLAQQHGINMNLMLPPHPLVVSTDAAIAHQLIISVLSYAIQQAHPGILSAHVTADRHSALLTIGFSAPMALYETTSAILKLAGRIHWRVVVTTQTDSGVQVTLHTTPGKATIMIIDDNEGWVELVGRFLEGYDCVVVSPNDQQDSITHAKELNPSLILLDVMMPKRDGWEILQRLRAQPSTADIPIIVCSVFNDPQLAYSLGASAFVAKPANRETVLETLQQLGVI